MKLTVLIFVLAGLLAAQPQTPAPSQTASPADSVVFNLPDAPLPEVIAVLAKRMKINYILDPRVKGSVILRAYGEFKAADLRGLLETILRVNGAALVQVGDLFRIVPVSDVARLPLEPRLVVQDEPVPPDWTVTEEGEQVTFTRPSSSGGSLQWTKKKAEMNETEFAVYKRSAAMRAKK